LSEYDCPSCGGKGTVTINYDLLPHGWELQEVGRHCTKCKWKEGKTGRYSISQ